MLYGARIMAELAPGTLVKTLRTDRDTLEQKWDMLGVVRWQDRGTEYETYFVSWRDYPGGRMLRDEIEPLDEVEKLDVIARLVMET